MLRLLRVTSPAADEYQSQTAVQTAAGTPIQVAYPRPVLTVTRVYDDIVKADIPFQCLINFSSIGFRQQRYHQQEAIDTKTVYLQGLSVTSKQISNERQNKISMMQNFSGHRFTDADW